MPNRFLRSAPLLCFDYVVFNKPGHLKLFQELLGNPSLAFRVLTVFEIPEEAYERGLLRCKFNLLTKRSWLFSLLKAAVSQDSWFYKGGPLASFDGTRDCYCFRLFPSGPGMEVVVKFLWINR
jgi:hypothetical protein